ncbi:MAG: choline dehydrogenase [Gammaproteobacteria bacterium]|nr:choline dehydrogenase [Gammaproteobacteria bacterium]
MNDQHAPLAGEFDYIIVGAGSAGCVLANRLSANPGCSVLVLEAGGKDDYFWIDIPVGYLFTIGNPRTDWCFKTTEDPGLAGRSLGYARGKVLGGCSSINAMIYMRGQREDFDHWASLGNRGWSWDEVLPDFKRMEDYAHGGDELHGVGGELRVEERRVSWEILDAWREAAEACGIPRIDEFNRGDNHGNAYFQMNQRRGMRWSATRAFLRPVLGRPNLQVRTGAQVHRLEYAAGESPLKVEGLLYRDAGGLKKVRARREVILASGAIGSPQILQLSGIGPAETLTAQGVAVRHALPGVGGSLHDHLQIRTVYRVSGAKTLNERANSLWGRVTMGLEYLLFRTGPLTMPPSQLGAFARSDTDQPTANIEWHVQPLSLDRFGEPLHPFPAITPSVCNLRPTSRGHVRILSPDPEAAPEIRLNYLSTPEDQKVAVDSLHYTRRIMASAPLARYRPEEWKPGPEITSPEAMMQAARELGTTIFHPVSTCRMGRDEAAVVDDRLRVHGVQGLRVVDASIMPRITSGNTNAPTMMIAEKAARFILAGE